MRSRFAVLLAAAALGACATANVAINRGFDFSRVKRVAVIGFRDYPGHSGSGDIVTGAFEQSLLNAGYDLVERGEVSKVLAEQKFSGSLDPKLAKTMGERLGVDALLFGQITDLAAPRDTVVKVDVVDDRTDPIYVHRTRRVTNPDGTVGEVRDDTITGYKTSRVVRREPRDYTISGRLGVSARLVFVGDGRLMWSGSDSTTTTSFADSARSLSDGILKAVKTTWPKAAKN